MRMKGKKVIFNYKDTWDMGYTLSKVIVPGLKKFREVYIEKSRGVPSLVMVGLFPDIKDGNYSDEHMQKGTEKWVEILDKMIYAFDHKNDPDSKNYDFKYVTTTLEVYEHGGRRISLDHTNEAEYQRYKADCEIYKEKVIEGRKLFAEFYDCLWD